MNGHDSLSKTAPDADQTFAPLAAHLSPNGRLRRTWPLAGGISADMTAVEMEDGNGRAQKFVVRQYGPTHQQQNPHIAAHEFQLLRRLQDAGIAAPPPHYADPAGALLGKPCLVMGYIEGQLDFAPADLPQAMRQFAHHLAQIHSLTDAKLGWPLLPRLGVACPELARPQSDSALETAPLRRALAAAVRPSSPTAVLLHGDYWPGNVLWQAGEITAVIDWEDARLGDPLFDLSISRLDVAWIFGPEARAIFTQAYVAETTVDTT
ncbi:MAG: phosphotransferase family protein, partial [Anaerolineales bacterium]|nr:phosphotransferase family protein [Anaerolineales bacterium]